LKSWQPYETMKILKWWFYFLPPLPGAPVCLIHQHFLQGRK
jgi:hypothetical protein